MRSLPAPVFASREMVRATGNAPAWSCSRSKRLTFRLRSEKTPQRTELDIRPLLRPCEVSAGRPGSTGEMVEHQGIAPCIPAWKAGACLSTPMLGEMESRAGIAPAFAALQAAT